MCWSAPPSRAPKRPHAPCGTSRRVTMPELLRMPAIAAGEESAALTEWPVAEHQEFAAADVIAVVETAKASVDVEAESAGLLVKILVEAGADVQVGQPLALLAA